MSWCRTWAMVGRPMATVLRPSGAVRAPMEIPSMVRHFEDMPSAYDQPSGAEAVNRRRVGKIEGVIGPFLDVQLAFGAVKEKLSAVRRQNLEAGLGKAAEDDVTLVSGRTLGADDADAGRDQGGRTGLIGGSCPGTARRPQGPSVSVAGGPLVVSTADHQVKLVIAGSGTSDVAGWTVVGDEQLVITRERQTEGITEADRPNRVVAAERVIGRNASVRVVAQDLAAQARGALRLVGDMILSDRDIELAVGTKGDPATFVATIRPAREIVDYRRQASACAAFILPANHALPALVVRPAVKRVDEAIAGKRWADRQAQKTAFARG